MSLGAECCTSLMCLAHLLWMSIAVPWHASLLPCRCECVSLSRRPWVFFLLSSKLVDGDEIPVSVFELALLVDELLDPVVVRQ